MKKIDEYEYVSNILKLMNKGNPVATNELIKTLSEEHQKYLKEIFQSKRITIERNGEHITVARRILKPKSKKLIVPPA
jgi:hypothetical protein